MVFPDWRYDPTGTCAQNIGIAYIYYGTRGPKMGHKWGTGAQEGSYGGVTKRTVETLWGGISTNQYFL